MGSALESTDIKNKLEDLTGVKLKPGENPYNALIETCNDDHVECPPFPCKVFFFLRFHSKGRACVVPREKGLWSGLGLGTDSAILK